METDDPSLGLSATQEGSVHFLAWLSLPVISVFILLLV